MDWVHCNSCFCQPTRDKRFSLTNCGHLLCSGCLEKGPQGHCPTCKAPCTTIGLSAKMRPDIEQYFSDALEVLKKQQKTIIQVLEFQKKHRDRYITHLRDHGQGDLGMRHQQLLDRTTALERENQMFRSQISKAAALERENQQLKAELHRLTGRTFNSSQPTTSAPQQSPIGAARAGMSNSCPAMRMPTAHQNTPIPGAMQRTMQRHESTTPRPSSGPKRILVRTPPINGKMGFIPSPTGRQTSQQALPQHTSAAPASHSYSRSRTTPSPSLSQSPMSFSPSGPSPRSFQISQQNSTQYYTPNVRPQQPTPGQSSAQQFGRPRTPR